MVADLDTSRFPFPAFPVGWYAAAFSDELAPGEVRPLTFLGQKVVLFRTESGRAALLDAFCPHMGAHLGIGGTVIGESIRCPMHAFRFDAQGACVATGYGTKPPTKCRGRAWPVLERNGAVLAYYHPEGEAPTWEPPEHSLESFSPIRRRTYDALRSHPQETTENSVDLGHLPVVHGYEDVRVVDPLRVDGPYLTTRYAMKRRSFLPGPPFEAVFHIHVWGLGYSFVEVEVPSHGFSTRHYVFATPNEGETITLRIGASFRIPRLSLGSRALRWLDRIVGPTLIENFENDVSQDFEIWTNKRYVHPPALAEGDGPVGRYRRWARQFYPELAPEGVSVAV